MESEQLRDEILLLVQPIVALTRNIDSSTEFLVSLGVSPSAATDNAAALGTSIDGAVALIQVFADENAPNIGASPLQTLPAVALLLGETLSLLRSLGEGIEQRFISAIAIEYLSKRSPEVITLLDVLGVIKPLSDELAFSRITLAFTDYSQWLRETVGWGANDAKHLHLNLSTVLEQLFLSLGDGIPYEAAIDETWKLALGIDSIEAPHALHLPVLAVGLPDVESDLLSGASSLHHNEAGLRLLPAVSGGDDPTPGLAIGFYSVPNSVANAMLDNGLEVTLDIPAVFNNGALLVVSPSGVDVVRQTQAVAVSDRARLAIDYRDPNGSFVLFDVPGVASVTAEGYSVSMQASLEGDLKLFGTFEELEFSFDFAQDSFLASLLDGPGSFRLHQLGLELSSEAGLGFVGGGRLGMRRSLAIDIGLVRLSSVAVQLDLDRGSIGMHVQGSARIGPVSVTIEDIGFAIEPDVEGNVWTSLDAVLVKPNALGLGLDAGAISGGGYIYHNQRDDSYTGALQLTLGSINLTAVGLLSTQLPNDEDGFSLILIITGTFPAIQLGFGFTLNALGGLIGINRSADTDALRSGLQAQALDAIMFPKNPAGNASRIVADIGGVFIPTQAQHVLGPMAVLQWGTPPVLRAEVGILLELDSPLRLIVLGQLSLGFPSLEVKPKLVEINLDVLGIIDFDREELTLDAVLFNSRIAAFDLSGEMALRMRWGARPFFILSIGGVHPAFERPPSLPDLQRLTLSLGSGNNPRVRLETYLCLTSNTIQVGAEVDVYAAAMGFNVSGQLGFDALFELEPFRFEANLRARVALRRGTTNILSVKLEFDLSGPTPWVVDGKATATLFFVDVSVPVRLSFGAADQPRLPRGDPWGALSEALKRAENWKNVLLPVDERLIVTRDSPEVAALVHPAARLEVRQTILPFGIALTRFGNLDPGDDRFFAINKVRIGLGVQSLEFDESSTSDVREYFASSQYFDLSEDERLSAPSFERLPAGAGGFGSDLYNAPAPGNLQRRHKQIRRITSYVREGKARDENAGEETLDSSLLEAAALFGATGEVHNAANNDAEHVSAFNIEDPQFVIATADTLTALQPDQKTKSFAAVPELGHAGAKTYAGARVALAAHLGRHPNDANHLLIVGTHELRAA